MTRAYTVRKRTTAETRCVKCGAADNMTYHHVIPQFLIKYANGINIKVKDRFIAQNTVPLCKPCHDEIEIIATKMIKFVISEERIKEHQLWARIPDRTINIARGSAFALIHHKEDMPLERQQYLRKIIADYLGKPNVTENDIEAVSMLNPRMTTNPEYINLAYIFFKKFGHEKILNMYHKTFEKFINNESFRIKEIFSF